ncbi:hypothetical protein RRG08_041785 [Elysia crispata]|uniref:Uncharacterized protein n=1 Tax=Elysia crispata TaxID=231223 RepID=A0AAE1B8W3_9GAST|nr:hypothetical protein RRG08_041785 [Elysia crispata]
MGGFILKRHPDISLRILQALGSQRAAVTEGKLRGWFETVYKEITSVGGDVLDHPSRIFNCDESGFQLSGSGFNKVLASKGEKRVYQVSTDTHTQMTVLACGSAAGEVHNPLIIFPGRRFNYDPLDEFPEAHLLGRTMDGSMGSPSPPGSRLPSSLLYSI